MRFPKELKQIIPDTIHVPIVEEERHKYYDKINNYDPIKNFDLKKQHYINVQMAYGDNKHKAKMKADKLFDSIFALEISSRMGW